MKERTTAISKEIEYETKECDNCGDEVLLDEDQMDNKNHPKGVTVIIGGGEHISVDKTKMTARGRNHRKPKIVTKWFGNNKEEITKTHLCQSCADGLYDFSQSQK